MTGIIKTDQIQGAQGSSVTVPTGHTFAVTSNATVGGTLSVTGDVTATNTSGNRTLGIITGTSNSSILNMGDTDAANVGQVKYHHGVNSMVLRTNGSDKVTLDSTGNLLFNAASTGVYLGVTSATASNLLDDYEEGTWTPAFQSTNASFSYGTQQGEYIKVGRIVYVSFRIQIGSGAPSGTTSNTTFLTGLPFTIDTTNHYAGSHVGHYFNLNKTDTDEEPVYQQAPGDTKMEIKMCGDLQGESNLTPAQMQAYFELRSAVTYLAAS